MKITVQWSSFDIDDLARRNELTGPEGPKNFLYQKWNYEMKPLIILLTAFTIAVFSIGIITGDYDIAFAARIAMSVMLVFTSIAHFAFTRGMVMMVPDLIPFKKEMVYGTGLLEILAAIGLQVPSARLMTAWLLIIFFILLLPANIQAAMRHVDYQKGNSEGSGSNYLWFRVPLQILFIGWIYFSSINH